MPLISYFQFTKIRSGKNRKKEFPWFLVGSRYLFLGFPLNSTLPGGINSPYLGEYLSVLFVGGAIAQSKVSPIWVGMFCIAELVFWFSASHFSRIGFRKAFFRIRFIFQLTKQAILLWALVVGIGRFLKTEEKLSKSAGDQSLALREVEMQLTQTAKMAEIGDLVKAGTAHELAQPDPGDFSFRFSHFKSHGREEKLRSVDPGSYLSAIDRVVGENGAFARAASKFRAQRSFPIQNF